jgi:hypothetical protein
VIAEIFYRWVSHAVLAAGVWAGYLGKYDVAGFFVALAAYFRIVSQE